MITLEAYLKFWDRDLLTIKISKEVKKALSANAVVFLTQYGLPSSERVYNERKKYLENTTPLPDIFLSEKSIERSIKSLKPYFEFNSSLFELFEFQGKEFIKIGSEGEFDIAIEVNSGSVNCILLDPPASWPAILPPLEQNRFINSSVEKLAMFLTEEFISRRERIVPTKQYFEAINSKNIKMVDKSEADINQIIDNLENEFKKMDDQINKTTNSYWQDYFVNLREM